MRGVRTNRRRIVAIGVAICFAGCVVRVAVAQEHLVWSDEFDGAGGVPDSANWKFETGGDGWGNHELETYCAPGSSVGLCVAAKPNVVVTDGYLHLVARRDAAGKWTSARMTTKGLQSFQYGRMEARIQIPAGPGVWPAF